MLLTIGRAAHNRQGLEPISKAWKQHPMLETISSRHKAQACDNAAKAIKQQQAGSNATRRGSLSQLSHVQRVLLLALLLACAGGARLAGGRAAGLGAASGAGAACFCVLR